MVWIHHRPFLRRERAVDVDHFLAVRAPAQHLVEERPLSLSFDDEINQRRHQRNRHEREIADIIEQHLDLEDGHVAQKSPMIIGARRGWRRQGREGFG